jgi:hypothetical protein
VTRSAECTERDALAQVGDLLRAAGRHMGLCNADADEMARSGELSLGDRAIVLTPVCWQDAAAQLLVTLVTGLSIDAPGGAAQTVLAHAPALLLAYRSTVGLSQGGDWLLHRTIDLEGVDAPALVDTLAETRWLEALLAEQSIQ